VRTNPEDQKRVLQAAADLGRANGLTAAAKLVATLADRKSRVVGTNDIRELVAALTEKADAMRSDAKDTLNFYSIILNN
jgi:hypothetical protein